MFSWGVAINGELGQGGLEDAHISSPSPVPFSSVEVVSISPGGRHTLMLTSRGEVFTCGSNDFGQLGREGSQTRLQQVTGLSQYNVVQISAGANHSLAVDEWGSLFSWGSDEYGQLGHNQGAATLRVPRLVKSLGTLRVTAVAAGMYHSAALTASGQLFTWGSNSKGQLGLGNKYNMVFSPTLVDCLDGSAGRPGLRRQPQPGSHRERSRVCLGGQQSRPAGPRGLRGSAGAGPGAHAPQPADLPLRPGRRI